MIVFYVDSEDNEKLDKFAESMSKHDNANIKKTENPNEVILSLDTDANFTARLSLDNVIDF